MGVDCGAAWIGEKPHESVAPPSPNLVKCWLGPWSPIAKMADRSSDLPSLPLVKMVVVTWSPIVKMKVRSSDLLSLSLVKIAKITRHP